MTLTVINSFTDVGAMGMKQVGTSTTETAPPTSRDDHTESSGICRCLFGPVDQAENAAVLASLRASMDRLSAARWDFDFASGRPLAGSRFEWTRRRPTQTGSDVTDRAALQPVNNSQSSYYHVALSPSSMTLSSPPMKRRRPDEAVTSSRRRRKNVGTDDVVREIAACVPASRQHRIARCRRRQIITGIHITNYRK